jgi:DNA-binding transcriptional regulator LsrR (DeoR family)
VVPLAGGSARLERDRGPGDLARAVADRTGGSHRDLYAPAFVASPALRSALVAEPEVAAVLLAWADLDVALVGIGAWTGGGAARSSLIASGALTDEEQAALRARGAVGELVVHPFDADGAFVAPDLAERAVAIPPSQLRRVPRVIAVAAGRDKGAAIRGALATGSIGILVTDAAAAAALLEAA